MPVVALAALAIAIVLIGIFVFIEFFSEQIEHLLNVSVGPYHPFEGIGRSLHNRLTEAANTQLEAHSKPMVDALNGMDVYLKTNIGSLRNFADGVERGFTYTYKTEIPAKVKERVDPLIKRLVPVEDFVKDEPQNRRDDLAKANAHSNTVAGTAFTNATAYTDEHVGNLDTKLGSEIAGVSGYVTSVVAPAAVNADQHATTALNELDQLTKTNGLVGTAAALATLPALETMMRAALTESGLDSAGCRTKFKGICGTDPSAWLQLLEGLALLEIGLNLPQLVAMARGLLKEAEPLIKAVA